MRRTLRWAVTAVLVPGAALLAACDRGDGGAAGDPAAADTGAMDGLTSDQLQDQIRPLTPEEAAQLGIIDSASENDQPAPAGPSAVIPGTGAPIPPADTGRAVQSPVPPPAGRP